MVDIDYIGEGSTDEAIARRLIETAGGRPGTAYLRPITGTGKQKVERKLQGLNQGARWGNPILALLDLDDEECAGGVVARLLPERHVKMLLRVCVRSAEAWLMADRDAYAKHMGISVRVLPDGPERQTSLKAQLLAWADSGKYPRLTETFRSRRQKGLQNWQIIGSIQTEFVTNYWDPIRAERSGRAPSLSRALTRLRDLAMHGDGPIA